MYIYIYTYINLRLCWILIVYSKAIQAGESRWHCSHLLVEKGPGPTFLPFGGDNYYIWPISLVGILEGFSCKTSISLMWLWLHVTSTHQILHRASVCNQLLASAVSQTNASPERCRAMSWECSPYSCHVMPFHYLLLVPININQYQYQSNPLLAININQSCSCWLGTQRNKKITRKHEIAKHRFERIQSKTSL